MHKMVSLAANCWCTVYVGYTKLNLYHIKTTTAEQIHCGTGALLCIHNVLLRMLFYVHALQKEFMHDLLLQSSPPLLYMYVYTYTASDINSAGYTVNATKYEAALFVDESATMVAEGTYLFTIGIILDTLDISTVIAFIGTVSGTGTVNINFAVDEGTSVDQLVVTTLEPLPVGVYIFSIHLAILDFANPDPVVSHVTEAEVQALPPPRKYMQALHTRMYIQCIQRGYLSKLYILHSEHG